MSNDPNPDKWPFQCANSNECPVNQRFDGMVKQVEEIHIALCGNQAMKIKGFGERLTNLEEKHAKLLTIAGGLSVLVVFVWEIFKAKFLR